MFGLGFQELLVVLVIALLLFGGNKLPEVGSALGKAIREFKRATIEPESTPIGPQAQVGSHPLPEADPNKSCPSESRSVQGSG
jgi:sec-independent protein translocase protein TatA